MSCIIDYCQLNLRIKIKEKMNKLITAFFLLVAAFISFSSHSAAQTCRVSIGKQTNGSVIYAEVYEFDYVDQKPEFPGGGQALINFINSNRVYPTDAYNNGVQGRVTCSFVVNSDGKVSHATVLRGVEESLNKEALRIINAMPSWLPGKINDQIVPVRVVCSIPFRK